MRSFFLCILLCSSLYCSAQTNYPNGVPGCLARWNFTNTGGPIASLPDVSGNNHNGIPSNVVSSSGFRSLTNKAMRFDGVSSIAQVPHDPSLNPSQITIVAVVKPLGFYLGNCQGNNIIYKSYAYFTNSGCWAMDIIDNDQNCSTYSGTEQLDFQGPIAPTYTMPQANLITANNWYFLVISYDGNTIKRYQTVMDANNYAASLSPVSTNVLNSPLGSNTYDVFIGATQNPAYKYWFNGDMDEIALFNRVLSDSEVHAVYTYLWGQLTVNVPNNHLFCDTVTVNYTTYNPDIFQAGNVFTAQLSDANGSFASPTNIGSVTSTMSGSISCMIPTTVPQGTGYRIRVVASNSTFTSPDNGTDISIIHPIGMHPHLNMNNSVLSLSTNFSTYQWYHNDSSIAGATNTTYTVAQPGTYFVRITNDNGCVGYSDTITIFPTAVGYIGNNMVSFNVYPNPARNVLNCTYNNISDGVISIYDLAGKILVSKRLSPTIEVGSLSEGIYIYTVTEDGQVIVRGKIMKE